MGVNSEGGFENIISYNLFSGLGSYSVRIGYDVTNTTVIHHNSFVNKNCTSYANDIGSPYEYVQNTWYDPVAQKGNYWSDYNGIGSYEISEFSSDLYPLAESPVPTTLPETSNETSFNFFIMMPMGLIVLMIRRRKK
jgi:hypothetical protein